MPLATGDLADGYQYMSPVKTRTYSHRDPARVADEEYMAEAKRPSALESFP